MKRILLIVSAALLLAVASLPIAYYTFLRIIVTLTAVIVASKEIKQEINIWFILFGITAILFNPIIPIYLYQKSLWIPIDIVVALLFLSYSFKNQ